MCVKTTHSIAERSDLAMTQCTRNRVVCKRLGRREVVADFSGGQLTSDGGAMLLSKADEQLGLLESFAALFTDYRNPATVEHSLPDLLRQRVFGIALGYEDDNDHDELSRDPLLAAAVGKREPTGAGRRRERDRGRPLAGKSTLNRLELTPADANVQSRYKKTVLDMEGAERCFAKHFVRTHRGTPKLLVLDIDATDDPLHGQQEGRYFHGYYKAHVYLPLYVFCGYELLLAKQRPGHVDACEGTEEVLQWLVPMLRERWPKVQIIVRGDSAFARDEIMTWCEDNGVDYVFGLAKNSRLLAEVDVHLLLAELRSTRTGRPVRVFKDFRYRTRDSWTRERRVVGKAEHTLAGPNPRFIVTSLQRFGCKGWGGQRLYEELYCGRGDAENRIKEQQLHLFADRTSASKLRANQIRLWEASLAYVLANAIRREGLQGTPLARAQCNTIRERLLKIGAAVRVTTRKVWIALSSSYPWKTLFRSVWDRLDALPRGPVWVPQRC
jgi:hypothetical protein